MAQIKNIFIVCGEPSGDLLAGGLAKEIVKLEPLVKISGVGGINLKDAGAEIICDIKDLSVMGLFDVLRKLPRFFALKKTVLEWVGTHKPDAIIFVDFSGFNLRLAKALKKRIPAFYYVSPQVWASREKRISCIKKYISEMIVLFRFEEEFYAKRMIKAHFVGHPLVQSVGPSMGKREFLEQHKLDPSRKIISLLPGSRKQEVKTLLPLMIKTAEIIAQNMPGMQFIIAKAPGLEESIYRKECGKTALEIAIVEGKTYDCLNSSDFCLVCSGTATLEAAIMQKPFFILYKMNLFNYALYRPQVKVPYIGIVNIVAGKKIVPEYIQFNARAALIARAALKFLQDPGQNARMLEDLACLKNSLGAPGAAGRAAALILSFLHKK
jgi:lipid-A-disaccharide synthase